MPDFKCIPGGQLAFTATTIAIAIAKEVQDNDDLNILASLFTVIGDNIALIAAQRQACESSNSSDSNNSATDNTDKKNQ